MKRIIKLSIALLMFSPAFVFGCSLSQDAERFNEPEENYPNFQYVFIAEVIEIREEEDLSGRTFEMRVSNDFKNSIPGDMIKVSTPGHSCGTFLSVGQELLIMSNDFTAIDETTPQYQVSNMADRDNFIRRLSGGIENNTVCPTVYAPVCAERIVQCIQAPCPPVRETVSNRCVANSQGLDVISEGECPAPIINPVLQKPEVNPEPNLPVIPREINDFTEPVAGPPTVDTFTSPITPPPNVIQNVEVERPMTIWERARLFFSGLLFWR